MSSQNNKNQRKYMLSHLNNYFGFHLVESLRNDHVNDLNPHQFKGKFINFANPLPKGPVQIIEDQSIQNLVKEALNSDYIIYELENNDFQEIKIIIKSLQYNRYKSEKTLVLISSVLTYYNNQNQKIDDKMMNKKTIGKYQKYLELEKIAMDQSVLINKNLKVKIICSGITYGCGENIEGIMYKRFRETYTQEKEYLKIINNGNNIIPLIHIVDLSNFVCVVLDSEKSQQQQEAIEHLIITDDGMNSQKEIIETISDMMGNGQTKNVQLFEALMENNSEEWLLDLGNLERTKKYDDIFEMKYKSGLVKNMESIITEFMKYRGLVVNKIIIGGLPSIGKSEISYKLANKCGVIHIQVGQLIDSVMHQEQSEFSEGLRAELKMVHSQNVEEQRIQFEENKKKKGAKPKKGEELQEFDENSVQTRLTDSMLIRIFHRRLLQNDCKLKGYLLDGFPQSYSQLKALYQLSPDIQPTFVVLLDSNIDILKDKISKLDPEIKENTHHNEEAFNRRILNFKERFPSFIDNFKEIFSNNHTLINVFQVDNLEINELSQQVIGWITETNSFKVYKKINEEYDEILNKYLKEQNKIQYQKELEKQEQLQFLEELDQKKKEEEEEQKQLDQIRKQEKNILDVKSQPLRQYMADLVIPYLTEILIELGQNQPKNPLNNLIDLLWKKADQLDDVFIKKMP